MQPGDFSSSLADRVKIQKRLGGVFVGAIAGVDHARLQPICEKLWRARGAVAQDENIGV